LEPLVIILVLVVALTILYQYRYIFSFLRYRLTLKSVEKRVETPSKPKAKKVCPRCGDAMEEGYLVGPSGIYWSKGVSPYMPHDFGPSLLRPILGSEPLTFSPFYGGVPSLRAYRCRKCGIIHVDIRLQEF